MEIFFIIALGVTIAALGTLTYGFPRKMIPSIAVNPTEGLSNVAKHLYEEYMALPEDSRPFPDIIPILRGLDAATAHDATARQNHYDENAYMRNFSIRSCGTPPSYAAELWTYQFTWNPDRQISCNKNRGRECDFHAYYDLHVEIQNVKTELQKKERALSRASNAAHIDAAQQLMEALRQERGIQSQVVRELEG